jgi:hypothetical protein
MVSGEWWLFTGVSSSYCLLLCFTILMIGMRMVMKRHESCLQFTSSNHLSQHLLFLLLATLFHSHDR